MNTPVVATPDRRRAEFDRKLKQIEKDELKLRALEEELLKLQYRLVTESAPIIQEFCDRRFEILCRLKQFLSDSEFKKKELRQLRQLMVHLAAGLQEFGDPRSQSFLDELLTAEELEPEERAENHQSQHFTPPPKPKHQEAEKIEIKTLFRQLAKAFHPDKEPLEHLKEEKTTLMKKITAAYENQDLSGLLRLEKEHLGAREISEEKIELYIKHINERLKEVRAYEHRLKKHGPLAQIYRFLYDRKTTLQEYNIRTELSKLEDEVQREKELQPMLWDRSSLKNFLRKF